MLVHTCQLGLMHGMCEKLRKVLELPLQKNTVPLYFRLFCRLNDILNRQVNVWYGSRFAIDRYLAVVASTSLG
jgi:hypothetical protein